MICVVIWWANLNGLFPGMDGWKNEKDRQTMYSLAKRVGGDYNKLTDAERKWVEETAHGHGRMSMGMYSGQAGVSATPPVPAPGRGAPGPGRTPPDNKAHP